MKRAATLSLAMTLLTLNATLFTPAFAQGGFLSDLVRDTLDTAAGVVGGVVGGAAGITAGAVSGASSIVTGTVDAAGNVLDTSGNIVGRVVVGPNTTTVAPGWTYVTPGSTTTTTTVVPGTTQTRIYTFGTAPTVYSATLETRISDLRNAISTAETRGTLTATQAAEMRADLDRIASGYTTARVNNTMTFDSALNVARDLDTFNTRLATALNVRPFRELVIVQEGNPRLLVSNTVIPGATTTWPGNVATTTIGGAGNVIGGVVGGVGNIVGGTLGSVFGTGGSLIGSTVGTAGNLVRGTVNTAGEIVDSSGRVIGTVVPGALDAAVTPITGGTTRVVVGSTTNVLGMNIDLRLAEMRRVIADMQMQGRLTPQQFAQMTTNLDRVAMTLSTDRASGRTLTFDEAIGIARDLDTVSTTFGTFVGTNPWQPMVLMQAGSPTMQIITSNGVVSAVPGMSALPSTTGLVGTTTNTRISTGPAFTPASPLAVLPILDQRRYELDRIITTSVNSRTLSLPQATALTNDLNRIAGYIASARNDNTITIDKVVTYARQLDDFNTKLSTTLHGSSLSPLTLVATGSSVPALSSSQFANVIGIQTVQPTVWTNTFSARRAELESMIASGLSGGQITAQQATELRAELARIAKLETTVRTSGLTYTNALPIAMNLDVLGNRIKTFVPTATCTPLIAQSRLRFVGGPAALIDEVSLRRAEISASIDRELALGRLTNAEAIRLRAEVNTALSRETRYRADGVLTYREASLVTAALSRVAARLNSLVAGRRGTVSVVR